jgi:hypothetical protein
MEKEYTQQEDAPDKGSCNECWAKECECYHNGSYWCFPCLIAHFEIEIFDCALEIWSDVEAAERHSETVEIDALGDDPATVTIGAGTNATTISFKRLIDARAMRRLVTARQNANLGSISNAINAHFAGGLSHA